MTGQQKTLGEMKCANYAYCGTSFAPAPGDSDRRGGIAAGLIFLFTAEARAGDRGVQPRRGDWAQVVVLPLFAALRLRPRGHFRLSPAASAEAKSGR